MARKISLLASKRLQLWLAAGMVMLLASCASDPPVPRETVLQQSRHYPADSDGGNLRTRGFLVAYTPADIHFNDKGKRFYRHTGYYIFRWGDEQPINYVPNHLSATDEAATIVSLPAGYYRVKTQTVHGQPIFIPIVIRPAVTTTINLEDGSSPPTPAAGELYWVRLDARKVGWVADGPAAWPQTIDQAEFSIPVIR